MNDRTTPLFEPDALLPAQFYSAFRGAGAMGGERRLMLAVLQDALDCFRKYAAARDSAGRQLFDETCEWISSRNRKWSFSFENICETLEIDPDYLRRGLRVWYREVTPSRRPASRGRHDRHDETLRQVI